MILINFASRSRPDKFHACMKNLSECFTDYKVLLKVDRDDPTVRDYFSVCCDETILALGYSKSKVDAINRDIPKDGWDILVNTSDDILWNEGAGEEILKSIEPDMFLHFPEPYADSQAVRKGADTISVVSIMDKIYYDRFGYVYNPSYLSLCCDNEATEVARNLGRYKFVDKYIFEHLHPAAGKAVKDAQYKHTESFFSKDKATYERRKRNSFA